MDNKADVVNQKATLSRHDRKSEGLSALGVKRLEKRGMHAVGGVAGLILQISAKGAKSWIYRYRLNGKRRCFGLGGYPAISLAEARAACAEAYKLVRQGVDPIDQKLHSKARAANVMTFDIASKLYVDGHAAGWRSMKQAPQWTSSLAKYASPFIGHIDVANINRDDILKILEQPTEFKKEDGVTTIEKLWTCKTVTANRVRGRIKLIIDWCKARGYRTGENPAVMEANLAAVLPSIKKMSIIKPIRHHPAVQIDDVPAFASELSEFSGMSAKALLFSMLTAVRSKEARGAKWTELELDNALWTVPKDRTKSGRTDHRVPLSNQALALLAALPRIEGSEYVFPNAKNEPLSDTALSKIVKRMSFKDKNGSVAVPHGLRSSFRDWVAERTTFDGVLAELALHHTVGNKVEAAYRRGDAFERRKELMQSWADYCTGTMPVSDKLTASPVEAG